VRRAFKALRRRGRLFRPVIVVGANAEALSLCALLAENQWLGYRVLGVVDDQATPDDLFHEAVPVLGPISEVLGMARRTGVTGVVVATTAVSSETSNRLARQLTDAGIHVELSSSLRDIAAERLTVSPLGRCPMIYVEPIRRNGWRAAAKRAFDIVVAAAALVLATPVLLVVALAIKVDTRGPVLFRQQRLGRGGQPFNLFKFRTMVTVAEELIVHLRVLNQADGPLFKIRDDPRVTRIGRLLRKYSIDELPQLWNVLRGEMSLVGPRPALPAEMAAWAPELHNRLRVKPGVTGMWQVSGRSDCSFAEYMRLDLYYVDNWSFWSDLAIVAKTVPTVLLRRGAY
jgi:exopolysaccharide biosynthesis polyprenyl glycosylphosphotransferase